MELSQKARKELDDIVHFIHWQTSHLCGDILKVYMTPIMQHPHSVRFVHPQIDEDHSEHERLAKAFRKIDLVSLRKETSDPEIGAWFSVDFEIDCDANWDLEIEDRDIKVNFNYDKRFNVLNKNFLYNSKDLVLPTDEMILKDLQRNPRSEENLPSWYASMVETIESEKNLTNQSEIVNELFAEAFSKVPEMTGGYARVAHIPFWQNLWSTVSTHFERSMKTQPYVIRAFVDPKYRFMRYDSLLWAAREFSDLLARTNYETNRTALSAKIFNGAATVGEYIGPVGKFDLKDLSSEEVERAFSDVIYQMLTLQNRQRFPEYFNK